VFKEHRGFREIRATKETPERVFKGRKEFKVVLVIKAYKDPLDCKDSRAQTETSGHRDYKVFKENRDLRAYRDCKDFRVCRVYRVFKDSREFRAIKDLDCKGFRVYKDLQERFSL
jgi:hypothetical protein